MKRLFLLASLWSACALAQQADITGAQLLSGEADARLQSMARDAASSGRKLVISAPEYWHEMILEQVRRGGGDNLEIEVRDSFAESVLVREESAVPETPVAEPAAVPAPVAAPAPAAPVAARPTPAPTPAPVAAPVAVPAPRRSTRDAEITTIKRRVEQNLNGGEPVTRSLTQLQLESGDVIYDRGLVKAVQRRSSLRNQIYWLDGDIELRRIELKELGPGRYQVMERIRGDGAKATLRAERTTERQMFTAEAPAKHAAERKQMEQRYNGGNPITAEIPATGLRQRDIVYVGDDLAVVVRVNGLALERYWLVGKVDLGRAELIKDGANKYRVLQDVSR
jgi:biotin carboxyl carrier protein